MTKLLSLLPVFLFLYGPPAHADLVNDVEKLRPRTFCVNANLQNTWEAAGNVLRRMEIPPTLADPVYHVIATEFIQADHEKLFKIANDVRPFAQGRFTLKISMEEVTPEFTKLHIVLQVRQFKIKSEKETILPSKGSFEKYLAYLINTQAINAQFPALREIRLGMSLIPDLKTGRYHLMDVEPDSPAGEAGFQDEDQLIAIGGREITIRGELFQEFLSLERTQLIKMKISRKKKGEKTLLVWIIRTKATDVDFGVKWGRNAKQKTITVQEVLPDSHAADAGFEKGDILQAVSGMKVKSFADYYRALAHLTSIKGPATFSLQRGETDTEITLN
ncbi:MAG: PDZ domain-containing protein [Candidatus Omnitrophica bacterium]|nr:PDZ domain-containing protein [Candidatus Omnitrophota bacterium]